MFILDLSPQPTAKRANECKRYQPGDIAVEDKADTTPVSGTAWVNGEIVTTWDGANLVFVTRLHHKFEDSEYPRPQLSATKRIRKKEKTGRYLGQIFFRGSLL